MKGQNRLMHCEKLNIFLLFSLALLIFTTVTQIKASARSSQTGNTINGFVFGLQRQPVSDVTVELLDDYSRAISRTRTNSSGRYTFGGLKAGRFSVRVLPFGMDYEEQQQEIEIQNFAASMPSGQTVTSGYENKQLDFYLKLKKGVQTETRTESIFVQEVPEQAKQIYKKALELMDNKKEEEALKELKTSLEIFPDYYDALERLGTEYVKGQHFVPAEILLSRAVQINPRGAKSWYGLAYAQYSQDKINEAIESVQKAISLNQFYVDAFLLEGVLQRRAGRFELAEKQLKKAKEISKNSVAEVHWQLALLYSKNLNRYTDAADELELFLKARPESKDAENIKKLIKQFRDKAKEKTQ